MITIKSVFAGIIIAQTIATLQVYLSNIDIYRTSEAIIRAGYLSVPNSHVMPDLLKFSSAFYGGLFFTFTIGAGLSLFSSAFFRLRHYLSGKRFFILVIIFFGVCIIIVNYQGVSLLTSAYFIFIPLTVLAVLRKQEYKALNLKWICIHLICIIVMAFCGLHHGKFDIFVDFRDNILLTNETGIKAIDFYYRYTLYAANVFKSQKQKLIKTYCIKSDNLIPKIGKRNAQIQNTLLKYDYLLLSKCVIPPPVDLNIEIHNDQIILRNNERSIIRSNINDFFQNAGEFLKEISNKSDKHVFFRQITFLSLVVILFLTPYICLCCVFNFVGIRAPVDALISCALIAAGVIIFFHAGIFIDKNGIENALSSERRDVRIGALRTALKEKIDIAKFTSCSQIQQSNDIAERYLLARALGNSTSPESFDLLLRLIDDSYFLVVYNAFKSMGMRKDQRAVQEILKRIKTNDHWYVQGYAYKALKHLGWKQKKLE